MKNNIRRFAITCHTPGLRANRRLLDSISHFCEVFKAEPLTLLTKPLRENAAVDEFIDEETILFKSRKLNSNLTILADRIAVTTSDDPTAQYLAEAGKTNSLIIASPKQFQKAVPRASGLPRYVMTSLSCDRADLLTDTRNERKAAQLHRQGLLIIEVVDDTIYYAHQIQAEKDGSFIFNSLRFMPSGHIKSEAAEVVSFGDTHLDHIDEAAEKAALNVIETVNPRIITQEDAFNGSSINHHEECNHLSNMNWMSLEEEARFTALKLEEHIMRARHVAPRFKQLVLKDSNHHDFLDRYISNFERWMRDNKNKSLALRLAVDADDDKHLLESLLRRYSPLKETRFLKVGEMFSVAGVEMSFHGHAGSNGAKGSAKQFQRALAMSNIGHTHVPEVCDTVFNAGTLSILRPAYASRGLTSWCHAVIVTYKSGSRQLVKIIDGEWKAEVSSETKRAIKRRMAL